MFLYFGKALVQVLQLTNVTKSTPVVGKGRITLKAKGMGGRRLVETTLGVIKVATSSSSDPNAETLRQRVIHVRARALSRLPRTRHKYAPARDTRLLAPPFPPPMAVREASLVSVTPLARLFPPPMPVREASLVPLTPLPRATMAVGRQPLRSVGPQHAA